MERPRVSDEALAGAALAVLAEHHELPKGRLMEETMRLVGRQPSARDARMSQIVDRLVDDGIILTERKPGGRGGLAVMCRLAENPSLPASEDVSLEDQVPAPASQALAPAPQPAKQEHLLDRLVENIEFLAQSTVQMAAKLEHGFADLRGRIAVVEARLTTLDNDVRASREEMRGSLSNLVDALATRLESIETTLEEIAADKERRQDNTDSIALAAIEQRLSANEQSLDGIEKAREALMRMIP